MARLVGKLYVNNIVSTYVARLDGVPADVAMRRMNIEAVTFCVGSKLSFDVFPASVSKSRIRIAGVDAFEPSSEALYPLRKKRKIEEAEDDSEASREKLAALKNKRLKQMMTQAKQSKPVEFVNATDSTFHSNENVVAGGTSIVCNMLTACMFLRRLSFDMGCHLRMCNMKTRNIVCSANIGFKLNLDWVVQDFELRGSECKVMYIPEEFTGCSIMIHGIVFVLYSSGMIVATGIKSPEGVQIAENHMHELFDGFKPGNKPESFDKSRPFMRDAATLEQLKGGKQNEKKARKLNAADKSQRKVTNCMRVMMKSLGQSTPHEADAYLQHLIQT